MPNPEYMEKQAELQWKMRGILMDWIVEVHQKFRLLPETLFIAVNLIDRFLSARVVSLVKVQLVGLTALFVASKYEEVICPSVTHFLHMTDGGYGVEEILKAERYMLSTLDFDLSYPNPLHFLRRISKADGYDIQTRTVAKFLIEISCVEHKLLKFKPSLLAAAGMWLARLCLERGEWVSANEPTISGIRAVLSIEPLCNLADAERFSRPTSCITLPMRRKSCSSARRSCWITCSTRSSTRRRRSSRR
jgi:G2/mitotic-specific cyclin 1/2